MDKNHEAVFEVALRVTMENIEEAEEEGCLEEAERLFDCYKVMQQLRFIYETVAFYAN